MTRPETFHDWRKLYHCLSAELGRHVNLSITLGDPLMDRETWKLSHQMDRVSLRMQAESGAVTKSYCLAVLEWLRDE